MRLVFAVIVALGVAQPAQAACVSPNFCVTNNGFSSYTINGEGPNPTLRLVRGQTYTFEVTSPGHPFYFIADTSAPHPQPGYDTLAECNNCIDNNTGVTSGTITFTVPAGAADTKAGYVCFIHAAMLGSITFVDSLCQGVSCNPGDQCHDAALCDSATGACLAPANKADGTACDDGDACTSGENCQAGVCGTPTSTVTCTAADACHDVGVCNPTTGVCTNPLAADGTTCDDGFACTTGDRCVSGSCMPTASSCACSIPSDCPPPDSCHDAATCNGLSQCVYAAKSDGTTCDDGNACTSGETCQAGVCGAPTSTVTCTAPDACHQVGTCDPSSGQCLHPAKADGTACDDANMCTSGETCQAGVCGAPTSTVTCTAPDMCHQAGTCSPSTGVCDHPAIPYCNPNMGYSSGGCSTGTPSRALALLALLAVVVLQARRRALARARAAREPGPTAR